MSSYFMCRFIFLLQYGMLLCFLCSDNILSYCMKSAGVVELLEVENTSFSCLRWRGECISLLWSRCNYSCRQKGCAHWHTIHCAKHVNHHKWLRVTQKIIPLNRVTLRPASVIWFVHEDRCKHQTLWVQPFHCSVFEVVCTLRSIWIMGEVFHILAM
jgi:hypothetical protein